MGSISHLKRAAMDQWKKFSRKDKAGGDVVFSLKEKTLRIKPLIITMGDS